MGLSGDQEKSDVGPEVDPKLKELVDSKYWKIRPCAMYKMELKGCVGMQARFYQYFVDGELKDCTEWQRDLINCEKWTDNKDYKAAEEVILNEESRIKKRFTSHNRNNIWEHRASPPEDWDKPLPEWMQKEQENTFLYHQAKAFKAGETLPTNPLSCNIM
ncbi:hypothetical protein M8J77_001913 [Diaphorina citri]|nr:hypothetical protein M8J77_001913 [Diaphorina citri]